MLKFKKTRNTKLFKCLNDQYSSKVTLIEINYYIKMCLFIYIEVLLLTQYFIIFMNNVNVLYSRILKYIL